MTATFTTKTSAIRSARRQLGATAKPAIDFTVINADGGFVWEPVAIPAPAKRVRAKRPIKPVEVLTRAAAPETPAAAPKPVKAAKVPVPAPLGKRAALLASVMAGNLPPAPDFSAETHKRYRAKLAAIVALVQARDLNALQDLKLPDYDSSARALVRYRDLAVLALNASKD